MSKEDEESGTKRSEDEDEVVEVRVDSGAATPAPTLYPSSPTTHASAEKTPADAAPPAAQHPDDDAPPAPAPAHAHQHVFADGGLKAWLTVSGSWMMIFSTFGMVSAFGVFEDYYVTVHGHSASDIAWIGSLQLCLVFVMGIFTGKLFDDGYFHHLVISGTVVYLFGLFMLSLADPGKYYQIFLAQGVCCGIGFGLVFLPTIGVVAHHFSQRRALAIGVAFTGSSLGGVVFAIALNNMFRPQSLGFANGVRVAASICAALTIAANALMRTDVPPRSKVQRAPAPNPLRFMRDRDYVLGVLSLSFVSFAIYFPVFYIQVDSRVHGISENLAFYTLSILNGVGVIGRLVPPFAADKLGILNMMALCILACGACTLGMFGITSNPGTRIPAVVLIAIFYGFFSGGVLSLAGAIGPALSRGLHEIGLRTGILFCAMGLCGLLGSPISGWLLGSDPATYRWWRPIVFAAVMFFVAGALMLGAVRDVARRKHSIWV